MSKNEDILKESSLIIKEIKTSFDNALVNKKEEAERKIKQIKVELEKEKDALAIFQAKIDEFEKNKSNLENKIKEHLNQAFQYQKEIERLAESKLEELKKMDELTQEIGKQRQEVEEKSADLKQKIEEKYEVTADMPESKKSKEEITPSLEEELSKLRKIGEVLGITEVPKPEEIVPEEKIVEEIEEKEAELETKEEVEIPEGPPAEEVPSEEEPVPEAEPAPEEEPLPKEEPAPAEEPVPEAEPAPEEEPLPKEEPAPAEEPVPEAEPAPEEEQEVEVLGEYVAPQAPSEEEEKEEKKDKLDELEQYRKSDTVEGEEPLFYFQGEDKIILDGECFFSAIDKRMENARELYQKLNDVSSPMDQFKIKHEIRNNQEILRKLFLRSIDKCEKESFSLAEYTTEVLNIDILKDIREHLSMLNWSEEGNFNFFNDYIENIKKNFLAKITPPEDYLMSIVKELKV